MPAIQLSLSSAVTWALQATAGYFSTNRTSATSQGWNSSPSLALWTQVYSAVYTLFTGPPGNPVSALASGGSLTSGHTYYYKVTGTGPKGQNGTSTAESASSSETSQMVSGANLSVTLTWDILTGATSYNVYRGAAPGGENLLVGTATAASGATSATFTDTGFAGTSQSPPASGPDNFVEFDLYSFTNAIGEAVTAGHALSLLVLPTGGASTCMLAPGSTNGLAWMLGGTSPTYTVPINGQLFYCEDPAGPGQVIDSTHRNLRITNGGAGTLTVTVVAVLGP